MLNHPSASYALPAFGDNSQSVDGVPSTDALNNTENSRILFVPESLNASLSFQEEIQ
jgi:hypothetical protein